MLALLPAQRPNIDRILSLPFIRKVSLLDGLMAQRIDCATVCKTVCETVCETVWRGMVC